MYTKQAADAINEIAKRSTQVDLARDLWTAARNAVDYLTVEDIAQLGSLRELIAAGELSGAYSLASTFETIVREEIPPHVWVALGGQLLTR